MWFVVRVLLAAEKKELFVILVPRDFNPEPRSRTRVLYHSTGNWTTVHYPQRSVIFLPRTSCTQQLPTQYRTQNKTTAALYHDVLAPAFYDCCIGAEPTPSHIQSANMINKRMVSLKLNLFIVNILNSTFFGDAISLIPSSPPLTI